MKHRYISASKQNGSLHAQRVLILSHSLEAKKRAHSPELAGSREEHGTTSDAAKDAGSYTGKLSLLKLLLKC
jgi:hypothetical protein